MSSAHTIIAIVEAAKREILADIARRDAVTQEKLCEILMRLEGAAKLNPADDMETT